MRGTEESLNERNALSELADDLAEGANSYEPCDDEPRHEYYVLEKASRILRELANVPNCVNIDDVTCGVGGCECEFCVVGDGECNRGKAIALYGLVGRCRAIAEEAEPKYSEEE